jgi:HK97 family phage major capsid protein
MTTIDDLIQSIEIEEEQTKKRYSRATAEIETALAKAKAEGRATLTEEEDGEIEAAFRTRDRARTDLVGIDTKLARARKVKSEEAEVELGLMERGHPDSTTTAPRPAYDRVARVGQEERTYHKGNTGKGGPFLRDIVKQYLFRDMEAEMRLTRHMQEERVERGVYLTRAAGDSATANYSGLVVPQYLVDMYAPAIANLRPFADICNKHDLPPDGMTVNISRITTPSTVALQATENASVAAGSDPGFDDTLLTENVQTAAGQETLSRQAIDRGTGIESIVMDDLFRRYATTLDATLITQAVTGLSAIGTATAFTSAAPALFSATPADSLYGKILSAASGVEAALLAYGVPTHAVMHSRRWYWMQSKVSALWPGITQPSIPVQAGGVTDAAGYNQGVRGILPSGLGVVVDNNISTALGGGTEDEIYVVPSTECHLWEDPNAPVFIRAEQPKAANLGVLLVLYGYFAYSFRRYANGIAKIGGTGLIAPVF